MTGKLPIGRSSARGRGEYQRCARLLGEARKAVGVSESELARRLGKPQSWVAKSEAGTRRVDFVELMTIAEALGVDIHKLIDAAKRTLTER